MRRTHLSAPSDLAGVVVSQVRASLAARDAAQPVGEPLSVAGPVAGRAFSTTAILGTPAADAGDRRM